MKTRLYLDRRSRPAGPPGAEPRYPVRLTVSAGQETAYMSTGVRLTEQEWARGNIRDAGVRIKLEGMRLRLDRTLETLRLEGRLHGLRAVEMKDLAAARIREEDEGERNAERGVLDCLSDYAAGKGSEGTRGVYLATARRLEAYRGFGRNFTFRDMTPVWLRGFEEFLAETAPSANARAIHLRNLRAVFNYAVRRGYTRAPYPFSSFKIRTEPTRDRSLTPEEVRAFMAAPCSPSQARYRDIFILGIMCCGMNLQDLLTVRELRAGRIEKTRAKTGQPISVRVEPEAMAIIERHRGKDWLLDPLDRAGYGNWERRLDRALKTIGRTYNPRTRRWEGEAVLPGVSYYWARHTWATAAAELDIPERTIAAALGHSTSRSVTSVYIRVDMRRKVDAANRAVIDHIFGKNL